MDSKAYITVKATIKVLNKEFPASFELGVRYSTPKELVRVIYRWTTGKLKSTDFVEVLSVSALDADVIVVDDSIEGILGSIGISKGSREPAKIVKFDWEVTDAK